MTTIPDHVGREAVRLLNADMANAPYSWPQDSDLALIVTVAKLLMNPPAPMTDPDEEAAKRVLGRLGGGRWEPHHIATVTEQMRKEFATRKEAWEAGR